MNIIIAGAGTVGFGLAQYFSGLNYQVTIIEQDERLCEQIKSKLDIFVVGGKASSPATLVTAGVSDADMLIAVTPSDETNLLACNFAMQSGVKKRIARIKSEMYTAASFVDLKALGITNVIEPEWETVKKILQYVEFPGVLETANFHSDSIYLRGYRVSEDMPVAGKTLFEIKQLSDMAPILIVAIIRDERSLPPIGSQRLLPGDKIVAIMPREAFKTFRALIDRQAEKPGKIIVSGESLIAIRLAKALKPLAEKVILIDPDREHGQAAAAELEGVDVHYGDCTNSDILQEFNIEQTGCFIAAGRDSEDNIMSCLLAKNSGAGMVIAVRYDDRYAGLFNSLGIDHVINPQDITSNMIIEKIQMVPIGTYLKLKSADIEILRLKAGRRSRVAGKSLRQLDKNFKKSVVVGAIVRGKEVIIPWGDIIIAENDEVIALCRREDTRWVNRLFGKQQWDTIESGSEQ
ncbi:MAG: Trk system potassium transporter TrkA [Candidatus Omnitrophica bacterium]|nr:Trk system potassium transporter TrkA [Candidatus Omnitrophota bacterium]